MFLIKVTYKKDLTLVDKFLIPHREFLEEGYKNNCFIVSGPQIPRSGGIILSQLKERTELETLMKNDPFSIEGIAEYEIIEFDPIKSHVDFKKFL